ncbi:MAG TPA: hypothetical protein VK890_11380, partial [Bacteroidia bacterium]|nr:hypothetical protein [Bacteroidia bacterium]
GTVIITAIIWNGGLVLIGRLIGPYWSEMSGKLGLMQNIILIIVVIIVIMFVGRYFLRRQTEAEEKK